MTGNSVAIPQLLRNRLVNRQCVAFVGHGFSSLAGMPSYQQLYQLLVAKAESNGSQGNRKKELEFAKKQLKRDGDLQASVKTIQGLLSADEIRTVLEEAYSSNRTSELSLPIRDRVDQRLRSFAESPWAGVITTNYDQLVKQSFVRFRTASQPWNSCGDDGFLGNLLSKSIGGGTFCVHLHRESFQENLAITPEDYISKWMKTPKVEMFLNSVMFCYTIVFLGCSLRDDFLFFRHAAWKQFSGYLPPCFALLPNKTEFKRRADSLSTNYGITPILYRDDELHLEFDAYLEAFRDLSDARRVQERIPEKVSIPENANINEVLASIGEINRAILFLTIENKNELPYSLLMDAELLDSKLPSTFITILRPISAAERTYRCLYLTSLGVLEDVRNVAYPHFRVPVKLIKDLKSLMPTVAPRKLQPAMPKQKPPSRDRAMDALLKLTEELLETVVRDLDVRPLIASRSATPLQRCNDILEVRSPADVLESISRVLAKFAHSRSEEPHHPTSPHRPVDQTESVKFNSDKKPKKGPIQLKIPKVFISYSHDSEPHKQRVLDLAQQLRADGVDVSLDRFIQSPPEGWPLWMLRQIDWADYVLCVFTERYNERCLGNQKPGEGKGVAWESTLMFNALYGRPQFNTKFIPVVFDSQDEKWIIQPLKGSSYFHLDNLDANVSGGYQNVYRLVTNQPEVTPAGVGAIHKLPPAKPLPIVQQTSVPTPVSTKSPTVPIMGESELRKRLGELLPAMFNSIVADMEADGYISGQNAPTVSRAIELVKFAKIRDELNMLIGLYLEIINPK